MSSCSSRPMDDLLARDREVGERLLVEGGGELLPGHGVGFEAVERAVAVGGQPAGLGRPLLVFGPLALAAGERVLVQSDLIRVHAGRVGEVDVGAGRDATDWPVRGFRPVRAFRSTVRKVPKWRMKTLLSSVNLVEAHVLSGLRREYRFPLQTVRKAIQYVKR